MALTEFGLEMQTNAPNPKDRVWVPLYRTKNVRFRFSSKRDADAAAELFRSIHAHVPVRSVPLED